MTELKINYLLKHTLFIADLVSCQSVYSGDTLYRKIKNEWIGKQAIQCKRKDGTTYIDWFETCDKDLIDTRYYNLDGTRKIN